MINLFLRHIPAGGKYQPYSARLPFTTFLHFSTQLSTAGMITAVMLLWLEKKKGKKGTPKEKMVSGRSSARFDAARARLLACGYDVANCELVEIHCNEQPGCEELDWIQNGFIQGFTEVGPNAGEANAVKSCHAPDATFFDRYNEPLGRWMVARRA